VWFWSSNYNNRFSLDPQWLFRLGSILTERLTLQISHFLHHFQQVQNINLAGLPRPNFLIYPAFTDFTVEYAEFAELVLAMALTL
jgi:hypothetical protein